MNPQTLYTLTALSPEQAEILGRAIHTSDFVIDGTILVKYTGNTARPIIPEHITKIAQLAFACNNTLEEIILPNGVTEIEGYAFLNCPALKSIQLPDTITMFHPKAFLDYEGTIYAPKALPDCSAFDNHKIMHLPTHNFSADDTVDFVINETVLTRYKGNSTSPVIPNGITSIDDWAFKDCESLISLTLPSSITSIGKSAFWGCKSLSTLVLPDRITSIKRAAFAGCTSLTSLVLPNNLTDIGYDAFADCNSLTSLSLPKSILKLHENAFLNYNGKLFVPLNLKNHPALRGHNVQYIV